MVHLKKKYFWHPEYIIRTISINLIYIWVLHPFLLWTHIHSLIPGIIGVGEPAMLSETTGALHAFRIPLMSVGNRGRQPKIGTYDNILSTAPDIADQAKVWP